MPAIGTYVAEFIASMDGFITPLKDGQREARQMVTDLKPIKQACLELGETLSVLGDATVGAMFEMTKKTADYGAELARLSQKTGASVQDLSGLKFAAEESGVSMEGLSTGLKFLEKNMEAAIGGSKSQVKAFTDLGISAEDLKASHGDVNAVFLTLADRFKDMPDGAEKTADALKILGRSGTELIPTLDLGSDAIQRMKDEAQRMGLVMTDEAAQNSVAFVQGLNQVKDATEGAGISIGTALLPQLTSLAGTIRDGIVDIGDFTRAHQGLTDAVFDVGAVLGAGGALFLGIGGFLAALPKLAGGWDLVSLGVKGVSGSVTTLTGSLTILEGASLADLPAALELIAGASTLAAGGAVLVAAAVGGAIGAFVDWLIKGTEVEKGLDSFSSHLVNLVGGWGSTKQAAESAAFTTKAAADALENHSALTMSATALGPPYTDVIKNSSEATKEAEEATKRFNTAVQGLVDSFTGNGTAEREFIAALYDINSAGKLSGDAIDAMKSSLDKYKNSTDPLIQALISQQKEENDLKYAMNLRWQVAKDATAAVEDQKKKFDAMQASWAAAVPIMQAVNAESLAWDGMLLKANTDLLPLNATVADYSKLLGGLKAPVIDIGPTKAEIAEHQRELTGMITSIRDSAGHLFDDVFVKGKSVFSSLADTVKGLFDSMMKSIFEDLAGGIAQTLLGGGLNGKGSLLGGLLGMTTGKGGSGGLLGSLLGGGGLAGLFGGGGASALGTGTIVTSSGALGMAGGGSTLAGTAGAGAAGAGGLGSSIAAFATNPWTIGIAGALAAGLVIWKSQAHHDADEFNKQINDMFVNTEHTGLLNQVVDQYDAAKKAGTLTMDQAKQAEDAVKALWATFQDQANQFASEGGNQAKVVAQAYQTWTSMFGTNLSDITGPMDAMVAQLKQQNDDAAAALKNSGTGMSDTATGVNQAIDELNAKLYDMARRLNAATNSVLQLSAAAAATTIHSPVITSPDAGGYGDDPGPYTYAPGGIRLYTWPDGSVHPYPLSTTPTTHYVPNPTVTTGSGRLPTITSSGLNIAVPAGQSTSTGAETDAKYRTVMDVLYRIANAIEKGGDVVMDGHNVGRALFPVFNDLILNDGMVLVSPK